MDAEYREALSLDNLLAHFPWQQFPQIRPNQQAALEAIAEHGSMTLEMPLGSGKTAVGYTVLAALADAGLGPVWYITPNKTLVDQVRQMHPEFTEAYGRREYDCLYYEPENGRPYKADEIPCLSLQDCRHRVNIETGQTKAEELGESPVTPCPYYLAKHQAKRAPMVVATTAFYLFNTMFGKQFEPPAGLVIEEAHQIADVLRRSLSYNITDYHLRQSIKLLGKVGAAEEARQLERFLKAMVQTLSRKPWIIPTLLEETELQEFIDILSEIDGDGLRQQLKEAISNGTVDARKEMETLKQLEEITYSLNRYIRSFSYSIADEGRHALNYVTYAASERGRSELKLVVKAYYVAPLVRKLMAPLTVAYSGTIGDNKVFGWETGIQLPFLSLPGTFPAENTMVALPTDTPDLRAAGRSRNQPARVLRQVAKGCRRFGEQGARSLVVVVSNKELDSFLRMAKEEGVDAVSYQNGSTPKEAMTRFKQGEGTVLAGTAANYGEGIDLPDGSAPVIWFLRPGYPSPKDPQSQFEEKRFGRQVWAVRNWRVMIQALQVRGRNIRSAEDLGAAIFISQHFRKFLAGALPEWLRPSYRGNLTLEETETAVAELLK